MINAKKIGLEFVAALQSLPNLLDALGGDADSIQYYSENRVVFGRRTQNNTREAILSMPLGSIMIVWQGSGPGRLGNAQVYAHNYSLYLRAPEIEDVGYEDICDWIVNDVPVGGSLKMLHTPIDPNCEPMDFQLPNSQRNTVVISADGTTYASTLLRDAPEAADLKIEHATITRNDPLDIVLHSGGGFVGRFVPVR